jgi:proteasome lid subunit RPN8/RPN11
MTAAATHAHPNETGGILIGVYLDGHPWVTAAIEIESKDRGRHHYKIPFGKTQPAVHATRQNDPRLGYLGDWHSHPRDVGPSTTDLATLGLISLKHPRSHNPTLIVVRHTTDGYTLDARRITTVAPRPCTIRLTGNVPPLALPENPQQEHRPRNPS